MRTTWGMQTMSMPQDYISKIVHRNPSGKRRIANPQAGSLADDPSPDPKGAPGQEKVLSSPVYPTVDPTRLPQEFRDTAF